MSAEIREELLHKLITLGTHYPEMRFGQLLCFACAMADERDLMDVEACDDATLLRAIGAHLNQKYAEKQGCGPTGALASVSALRDKLLASIRKFSTQNPEWSITTNVTTMAQLAHATLYDAEDDELAQGALTSERDETSKKVTS